MAKLLKGVHGRRRYVRIISQRARTFPRSLSDAFYIASHQAVRRDGRVIVAPVDPRALHETEFIMPKNGGIHFRGDASALHASTDPYVKTFLTGWIPPLVA